MPSLASRAFDAIVVLRLHTTAVCRTIFHRYGDEERLQAKVPLLPGATYAAFVRSMPVVCVDVLLTRITDGAA